MGKCCERDMKLFIRSYQLPRREFCGPGVAMFVILFAKPALHFRNRFLS
jgi:hypothetical protein